MKFVLNSFLEISCARVFGLLSSNSYLGLGERIIGVVRCYWLGKWSRTNGFFHCLGGPVAESGLDGRIIEIRFCAHWPAVSAIFGPGVRRNWPVNTGMRRYTRPCRRFSFGRHSNAGVTRSSSVASCWCVGSSSGRRWRSGSSRSRRRSRTRIGSCQPRIMSMGLLKIVALITVINVRREEDAHAASLGGFEKEPFVFNRKL